MAAMYYQSCPIALASEVLAERWTPLILREIVLMGHYHFGEIHRSLPRLSESLLAERLRHLENAGVIERLPNPAGRGSEYDPTKAGQELLQVLDDLGIWAQRWIELRKEDCDPAYLMQTIHVLLKTDRLPPATSVVRFDFRSDLRTYWLVLDRQSPEMCFHDPGRDVDMVVTADLEALTKVILGRLRLGDAIDSGDIVLDGSRELVRSFPQWLGLSRYAPYATELARAAEGGK
jgi:DNA-binding HxlR family transcriptional regulator